MRSEKGGCGVPRGDAGRGKVWGEKVVGKSIGVREEVARKIQVEGCFFASYSSSSNKTLNMRIWCSRGYAGKDREVMGWGWWGCLQTKTSSLSSKQLVIHTRYELQGILGVTTQSFWFQVVGDGAQNQGPLNHPQDWVIPLLIVWSEGGNK